MWLTVCGVFKRGLFYAQSYADFYANLGQALYFGLVFTGIFMLVLKVSSLFYLIISVISRGTLKLQNTCSANFLVSMLRSLLTRHN